MSETSQAHVTCTILESRGRGTQIEGGMLRISVVLHKYKWRVSVSISTQILTWQRVRWKVWEGRLRVYTIFPLYRTPWAVKRKISCHPPYYLKNAHIYFPENIQVTWLSSVWIQGLNG